MPQNRLPNQTTNEEQLNRQLSKTICFRLSVWVSLPAGQVHNARSNGFGPLGGDLGGRARAAVLVRP